MAASALWLAGWPALAALGVSAAGHAPLVYGTLRSGSRLFGPVATRFEPAGDEIWLTIDDGPDPEDTPRILDLLDAAGARATFFVRGDRARAHPSLIAEILRRGSTVANHSCHHPQASFWSLPPGRAASEIDDCNQALHELTGQAPRWFRPPVGMANPFVHRAVAAGWSARGFDGVAWRARDPEAVVGGILRGLRPGAIILLHEGRRGPAGEALNVRAIAGLLTALNQRGWRAVIPADER